MILIDYNQIILTTLFASIGKHQNIPIEESMIRHMFLNVIRSVRKKYKKDFGEVIICADGKNSWRKNVFPYYKASRKKSRDESELNWDNLFVIINTIREELQNYFPYKVIHLDHVEADDIIGVIAHRFGTAMNTGEPILIYSSDKDYIQLHVYGNVKQFNPVLKKWVRNNDPDKYLMEHIFKGDVGDGIPNILSPDNAIAIGERQKPATKKRIELFSGGEQNMDEVTKTRFHRNRMLIDLSQIPMEYQKQINEAFDVEPNGRAGMFNFFIEKRLQHLLPHIQDF